MTGVQTCALPIFSEAGKNRWQDAINLWISTNKKDDSKWNPPTDVSTANNNSISVRWSAPNDHDQANTNDVRITAKAYAVRDIVKFTLTVTPSGTGSATEMINTSSDSIDQTIHLDDGKYNLKFNAIDSGGNSGGGELNIGVNMPWNQLLLFNSESFQFS